MGPLPPAAWALALAPLALIVAAAPLWVYTVSLAGFGAAHVLCELRFVDLRFSARVGPRARWLLGALLGAVVVARVLGLVGALPYAAAVRAELVLVGLLAAAVAPLLGRRAWIGAAVVVAVGVGVIAAPIATFLGLAVAHNLTPVGFIADAAPPGRRLRVLLGGLVLFVGAPLIVASGGIQAALAAAGLGWPDASPLVEDGLRRHLGAYLHPALHEARWAAAAFSGAVLAQCLHYAAVIGWMPRLVGGGGGVVPWPRAPWGRIGVVAASAALLAGAFVDFGGARSWYGVAAAVHAWIEVPLLLVALAPERR